MDAIILAAGFATRLYPLTLHTPKALINVLGRPIIEHTILKLEKVKEIERIIILSNNRFYIDFLEWCKGFVAKEQLTKEIKIVSNGANSEEEKKGAVADMQLAMHLAAEKDIFVLASDNFFEFDLNEMVLDFRNTGASTVVVKDIKDKELIKKYSCVLLDDCNKITFFEEKPKEPKSTLCATACYLLKKEDADKIRNNRFENPDNMGNVIEFLHKESKVYGHVFEGFWADIGTRKDVEMMNLQGNI